MSNRHFVIHTDGGSRGNPGPAAIGAVIEENDQVVHTISKTIGVTTNNQAEYQAVHAALEYVLAQGAGSVDLFGDSELVIKQLRGEYKVKNVELGPWFVKIRSMINQIGKVTLSTVRREQNVPADLLVNRALDSQAGAQ